MEVKFENFLDTSNEYFPKILEILNKDEPNECFEKHHIIPKIYFKKNNLKVDNSKNNIKKLTPVDHFLIHYYYSKAALPEYLLNLCFSVNRMKKQSEKDYIEDSKLYEENKKTLSNLRKGSKHSPEVLKKISESVKKYFEFHSGPNKNKKFSESWKQNLSDSHKNSEACKKVLKETNKITSEKLKGKPRNQEICKKISENKKGKNKPFPKHDRSNIQNPNSRKVLQISTNKIYKSCREAALDNNIEPRTLWSGMKNNLEKYADFKFLNDSKASQKILQTSTNKIYESYIELSEELQISPGAIRIGIKKNLPKYKDYILID